MELPGGWPVDFGIEGDTIGQEERALVPIPERLHVGAVQGLLHLLPSYTQLWILPAASQRKEVPRMNGGWMLKCVRYDGSESVITRYSIHADALRDADMMNTAYQSTRYYVEPFDPIQRATFTNDALVNTMTARINENR